MELLAARFFYYASHVSPLAHARPESRVLPVVRINAVYAFTKLITARLSCPGAHARPESRVLPVVRINAVYAPLELLTARLSCPGACSPGKPCTSGSPYQRRVRFYKANHGSTFLSKRISRPESRVLPVVRINAVYAFTKLLTARLSCPGACSPGKSCTPGSPYQRRVRFYKANHGSTFLSSDNS